MAVGLLEDVAIIGAGLGGCALALALTAHGVSVKVYELRSANAEQLSSGVLLTPNGLRVLDKLSVFERISSRCFKPQYRIIRNSDDETIKRSLNSAERLTGYPNHRLWRKVLLDEMRTMLAERGNMIQFDSRFEGIISEDDDHGVEFLINGSTHTASLLLGCDGIHSLIRKHVSDVSIQYTGLLGLLAHVRRDAIQWPTPDYDFNATIQGDPGAIFFLPEDADNETMMVARQIKHPEQSRTDLEELFVDKQRLLGLFEQDYDAWGSTARKIIDGVRGNAESLICWPYMQMPKLDAWYSASGRVVITGDAAHAVPPSSGQGVNQALEDVLSLTTILSFIGGKTRPGQELSHQDRLRTLAAWQDIRQTKIDAVIHWATNVNNVTRLPAAERERLVAEGKVKAESTSDETRWLFEPDIETQMKECIHKLSQSM